MTGIAVGIDRKFYYNSGTDASPTYVEVDLVGDVSLDDFGAVDAEVPIRSSVYTLSLPARLKGFTWSLALAGDIAGAVYEVLRGYAFGRTQAQYADMSGNIIDSGEEGLKAYAFFTDFPFNAPLDDIGSTDATLKAGYFVETGTRIDPDWFIVP